MKLKLAVFFSVLTACCLQADLPWKKISIPSGKNILPNPEFTPVGNKLPGWSNYGGNPLVKSFVKYGNRSVFKVTAKGPGYHVGFNGKFQLKPDTAYTAYLLFKAEIPAKSKIALLYMELTPEGGKKQIIPAKNWTKPCSWTLVKTDFVTPKSTGIVKGSIYPALFHGEPVVETALIGVVERKVLSKEAAKNILNNADFAVKSAGFPLDWNPSFEGVKNLRFDGNKAICTTGKEAVYFVQNGIQLVPGKKYRLGGEIRTKNFKAKRGSFIVYNMHWQKEVGTAVFPENTKDWTPIEAVVTLPASKGNLYSFAVYINPGATGELEFRKPFLKPAEAEAAENIKPALSISTAYLMTPYAPKLYQIPVNDPVLTLSFDYPLPLKDSEYICEVSTRLKTDKEYLKQKNAFLKYKTIKVALAGVPAEKEGYLKLELKEKKSGKVISRAEYPFCIKNPVKISYPAEKQLNRMVKRLLTAKAENRTYNFSNPRDGWINIRLEKYTPSTKVYFDNSKTAIKPSRTEGGYEVMANLSAGDHTVTIENSNGGTFRINAVPEVVAYTYPKIPVKRDPYKRYYGEFTRKYLYPVITTYSFGYDINYVLNEHKEVRAMGKGWTGQHLLRPFVETPEAMAKRLNTKVKQADGMTYDEIHFNDLTVNWIYTQALWKLIDSEYPIFTWNSTNSDQVPGFHALNAHLFSAMLNQGKGKGRILYEGYARTTPTEEAADKYLQKHLTQTMRQASRLVGNAAENFTVVLGCYTNLGGYCTDGFAGPDVKVYWDKYFCKLANEKEFQDLFGVGLYAYWNSDEESIRWVSRLIQHYAVEGNKESLAKKYGYVFMPGHLKNGDFEQGNANWKALPAEKKSISFTKISGYGKIQSRQMEPQSKTVGDTVCTFTRSAKAPNRLVQKMTGFTPGKLYALRFAVADKADVSAKKPSGQIFPFRATLDGATCIREGLPLHKYEGELVVSQTRYLNLHTIVFRAEKKDITVTFDDWGGKNNPGKNGQTLLLNSVKVKPYFLD